MKLNREEPEPIFYSKIIDDWREAFPDLTKYGRRQLYQRVGPFMIGLGLEFDYNGNSGCYELYLMIDSLWYTNKSVFGTANFFVQIESNTYLDHSRLFQSKVELIKNKYGNILNHNVEFSDFINVFKAELNTKYKYYRYDKLGHSYVDTLFLGQMARNFEFLLALATYIDNEELAREIWQKIDKDVVRNCASHRLLTEGLSKDEWLEKLHNTVSDKNELMKCVEQNCQLPDVAKLQVGEFVGIDRFGMDKFNMDIPPRISWKDRINEFFR